MGGNCVGQLLAAGSRASPITRLSHMEEPVSKLFPRLSLPSFCFRPRSELNRRSICVVCRGAGAGAGCRWPHQRRGWAARRERGQRRLVGYPEGVLLLRLHQWATGWRPLTAKNDCQDC